MAETREEARRQFLLALVDAANDRVMAAQAENRHLRDLLARALPHIDPNDDQDAYELTQQIREATRG